MSANTKTKFRLIDLNVLCDLRNGPRTVCSIQMIVYPSKLVPSALARLQELLCVEQSEDGEWSITETGRRMHHEQWQLRQQAKAENNKPSARKQARRKMSASAHRAAREMFGASEGARYDVLDRETKNFTPKEFKKLASVYEDWAEWLYKCAALREPAPHFRN